MSEERRLRKVAAKCCAVDGNERSLHLAGLLLEQIDLLRKLRLARAGWSGEEKGRVGTYGHALDRFDELVEGGILRIDPLLEE